jgi:hypothetical protein
VGGGSDEAACSAEEGGVSVVRINGTAYGVSDATFELVRLSRRGRRAAERTRKKAAERLAKAATAFDRQALAAVQSRPHAEHVCVLSSHAVEAGIELQTDSSEFHGFHTALGEPTCAWCIVCEKRKTLGLGPTVFNDRERAAWRERWERLRRDAVEGLSPLDKAKRVIAKYRRPDACPGCEECE